MRFEREGEKITKVIIEDKDLEVNGRGVCIQVEGYKGSREEIDAVNNHVYIEKYEGQSQILVWNETVDPVIFNLTESTEDLADHDLFKCEVCNSIKNIEDSMKEEEGLVCEDCSDEYRTLACGHRTHPSKTITHEGITCCPDCYERIK